MMVFCRAAPGFVRVCLEYKTLKDHANEKEHIYEKEFSHETRWEFENEHEFEADSEFHLDIVQVAVHAVSRPPRRRQDDRGLQGLQGGGGAEAGDQLLLCQVQDLHPLQVNTASWLSFNTFSSFSLTCIL